MKKEDSINQIKTIIKPYIKNLEAFEQLNETSDFIKDLKVNSANLVDIILDIEEAYNIVIDNEDMEQMLTVGAAMKIIEKKLNP